MTACLWISVGVVWMRLVYEDIDIEYACMAYPARQSKLDCESNWCWIYEYSFVLYARCMGGVSFLHVADSFMLQRAGAVE